MNLLGAVKHNSYYVEGLNYGQNYDLCVAARYPSGLSGQECQSFQSYFLYPPSCFYQADTGYYPAILCPPLDSTGSVPENFIGYNIYSQGYVYAFLPPETTQYIMDVDPGIYILGLTAVYDLTSYGFPGETGESVMLDLVYQQKYGYYLDFSENWDSGSFDENEWTPTDANWAITYVNGNPAPAAEFSWDPMQTNYSVSLESFPFRGDILQQGKIWLDFDLKLANVNPTGDEKMDLQVWNWDSQVWTTVLSFSNSDGSFSWQSNHVDITAQAMNEVFKIRFNAHGTNSLDILSWFVDNIHVYRVCDAPTDLITYKDYDHITLEWTAPLDPHADWLHWDNGINYAAIGTCACAIDAAARWEPSQLTGLEGTLLTQIAFYPFEANCTYRVRVWQGEMADSLIVDQEVPEPVIDKWNYITLETPVPIDISEELWVGYNSLMLIGGYPMGCDEGPAVDGYGNWMNFDGWQTLLEINWDFNYNWNIEAYIEYPDGSPAKLGYSKSLDNSSDKGNRSLQGYDIYKSTTWPDTFNLIASVEQTITTYDDYDISGINCYKVIAKNILDEDTCYSSYSNESCENVSVPEVSSEKSFKIYPNPAKDKLFIESSSIIKKIQIYDFQGKILLNSAPEAYSTNMDLKTIPNGMYFVEVENDAGRFFEKVIVMK